MNPIEDFIYGYDGEQRDMLLYLHQWLHQQLDLDPKIRYKIPFYYKKSWICYINPIKENGIELAFTRGNELSNVQNILESKGRKQIRGINLYAMSEIPVKLLEEIMQEAILLDEQVPYASKRKRKK